MRVGERRHDEGRCCRWRRCCSCWRSGGNGMRQLRRRIGQRQAGHAGELFHLYRMSSPQFLALLLLLLVEPLAQCSCLRQHALARLRAVLLERERERLILRKCHGLAQRLVRGSYSGGRCRNCCLRHSQLGRRCLSLSLSLSLRGLRPGTIRPLLGLGFLACLLLLRLLLLRLIVRFLCQQRHCSKLGVPLGRRPLLCRNRSGGGGRGCAAVLAAQEPCYCGVARGLGHAKGSAAGK
mmetsp:Transcript_73527/g.177425  ORF Transcript_73527/g.177425 Transcript_73527/m.177425 type:complete len:237 (-) Transcript_73527:1203-1913(-)